MPHYKDLNENIFWYSDQQIIEGIIMPGLVPISDSEADTFRANKAAQFKVTLQEEAISSLAKSDIVILRCVENLVSVPIEWNTYRNALRAIINGTDRVSTALPTIPTYPLGT